MRRIALCLLLLQLVFSAMAQKIWTVETVPNTRLQSDSIHVSDPDGFLSDSAEANINTALCAIREQADVFVVTLASIGEVEPKHFATSLFNRWGIGDAEANNGVLLLFVEDQHALEFETGYGAEGTLTDAKCERIFTKTIVPYFKAGNYEGGLCAGVADIVNVYGGVVPDGLKTELPEKKKEFKDPRGIADELGMSWYTFFFFLFMMLTPLLGFIYWIVKLGIKDKSVAKLYNATDEGDAVYIDATASKWSGSPWGGMGCFGGLLIGFSVFLCAIVAFLVVTGGFPNLQGNAQDHWWIAVTLIIYLTFVSFCHNRRLMRISKRLAQKSLHPKEIYETAFSHTSNQVAMWMAPWLGFIYFLKLKRRIKNASETLCPACEAAMQVDGNIALTEAHETEARLDALRFEPYRCAYGHKYVLKQKGSRFAEFTTCKACGAYTSLKTKSETIREADYSHSGEKRETYVCQHCGETTIKSVSIPKKVRTYTSGTSSGGGHSSSGRSHSSYSGGGSFGGGHSGGGGFSGRW